MIIGNIVSTKARIFKLVITNVKPKPIIALNIKVSKQALIKATLNFRWGFNTDLKKYLCE